MEAENYYDVLFGYSGLTAEGIELHSIKEVADFIHTHSGGLITEADGTPLLEIAYGNYFQESNETDLYVELDDDTVRNEGDSMHIVFCNDMRYKYELMQELRKGKGFEDRYWLYNNRKGDQPIDLF